MGAVDASLHIIQPKHCTCWPLERARAEDSIAFQLALDGNWSFSAIAISHPKELKLSALITRCTTAATPLVLFCISGERRRAESLSPINSFQNAYPGTYSNFSFQIFNNDKYQFTTNCETCHEFSLS